MTLEVSLAMPAVTDGAAPRYWMLRMSVPASELNSSSDNSVAEPPVAWVSWPGCFLASAISSASEFAGTLTLTMTASGIDMTRPSGRKLFCGS